MVYRLPAALILTLSTVASAQLTVPDYSTRDTVRIIEALGLTMPEQKEILKILLDDFDRTHRQAVELLRSDIASLPDSTGAIMEYLPADTQYVGVDLSSDYIEHAKSLHDRGTFICASVGDLDLVEAGAPTVVLAIGLLHHLDDEEVHKLFQDISRVMAEGSRLITSDACLLKRIHPLARLLIRMDRGQNVRTPDAYRLLAERTFADVEVSVRSDLLRVPYDHAILTCCCVR